jgi:DNA-binding transcriptional regulator GbsR (MarR family)
MIDQRHFLDETGAFFAAHGMSPIAGRLFAHLLVCDPPEQTFEMLCEALGASRASVSMMTRLLVQIGLVERLPGRGRRLSYRLHADAWTRLLEDDLRNATRLRDLAAAGQRLLQRRRAQAKQRVDSMQRFYTFLEKETADMLKKWKQARA